MKLLEHAVEIVDDADVVAVDVDLGLLRFDLQLQRAFVDVRSVAAVAGVRLRNVTAAEPRIVVAAVIAAEHPTVQPAVQPGIVEAVSAVVARDDVDRRVAGTWIVRTARRCRAGNRSAFARTAVPRNARAGVAAVLLSA